MDLSGIIEKLIFKLDNIRSNLIVINEHYKNSNIISIEILELLQSISENIDVSNDKSIEAYDKYLNIIPTEQLTAEEKILKKNILINENIKKLFLPQMILLRLQLENQSF